MADLECCDTTPLPFNDSSVDEFLLSHIIEHIKNPLPLMQELYRVARPNALMTIRVPHGASDHAWTDPTHVHPYFARSFGYFSQPFYWRADYGYRGDWQVNLITYTVQRTRFGNMQASQIIEHVESLRNVVTEMVAELTAVKPMRPADNSLQTAPPIKIQLVG